MREESYAALLEEATEQLSSLFRVDQPTVERLLQSMTEEERDILVKECRHSGPTLHRSGLEYNTVGYQAYVRAIGRFAEVVEETFMREEAVRC